MTSRFVAFATVVVVVATACSASSPTPTPPTQASGAPTGQPGLSAGGGLASLIQDISKDLINPGTGRTFSTPYRDLAPVTRLITVTGNGNVGPVTVTGAAGAIPSALLTRPGQQPRVRVVALEWGTGVCVPVGQGGSFSSQLQVGPGSTLAIDVIPPVPPGRPPNPEAVLGECVSSQPEGSSVALVRTPDGVPAGAPNTAFRVSGDDAETVGAPNQGFRWVAQGELTGGAPFMQFQLPEGPPRQCELPRLYVMKLFDAQGGYVTQADVNVSGPVITPTGLPVETDQGYRSYWSFVTPPPAQQCLAAGARYDLSGWTAGLDPGWYRARIAFYQRRPDGSLFIITDAGNVDTDPQSPFDADSIEAAQGIGYLPLVNIGNAATPRLPATLFNDDASWGSGGIRGLVANEDQGRFALGSRVAPPAPFIASPRDPLSGRRLKYLLEPFLPTLDYTNFDYVLPQAPLIPLDPAGGKLSVSLTTPDGKTQVLSQDAPITQSFLTGTGNLNYQIETTFHGPGHTLGLTTGLPGLLVDFTQYGKHTVTLSGSVRSIWGQELALKGTYDFTVAEPLELGLGTLQGTPLAVGEELSPVVVVKPGVPADIEVAVDHYVDGDPAKKQLFTTSGKADRYGYFVAKQAWQPSAQGEYALRVTATYKDPADGTLWMGIRTAASIVATPNSPLIAHGERNSALSQEITHDGVLRTWFLTKTFDPKCGEAACDPIGQHGARSVGPYPYFRGDVAWVVDMSPILPSVTLEDPTSILGRLAPQVASRNTQPAGSGAPVKSADMLKLSSHTTAGNGASGHPGAVDSWAYWYTSAVHANGVNIHETASEAHSIHDHWYGHESYNCQIGLPCFGAFEVPGPNPSSDPDRNGDEEGDVKFLFGAAVVKSAQGQQFVPYASTAIITPEALQGPGNPPTYTFRDPKGNRICPPYQGQASGLATCGPQLTIAGKAYDLLVTPTGTRPGSVLEVGDNFVFSGQVSPTLDVGAVITVTSPSGKTQRFDARASLIGYIDSKGKSMTVSEPGVYTVHVALTQDRVVPSTGIAPSTPIIADGKTPQAAYGGPLSAIMGSPDSTYHFVVADPTDAPVATEITNRQSGAGHRVPASITFTFTPPAGATGLRAIVAGRGLVLRDEAATGGGPMRVQLDTDKLYADGYSNIVLGSESLDVVFTGVAGGKPFAKYVNLRGMTPFGGTRAVIR